MTDPSKEDQAVEALWKFEEVTPGVPASTPDAAERSGPMNLYGGAGLGPGQIDDSGLRLDGDRSYAEVPTVPVDTSSSFTVAAWVQASELSERPVTVLSAPGNVRSAFELRFLPTPGELDGYGSWELTFSEEDGAGAVTRRITNGEFYDVRDWNHLTVVYNSRAEQAQLYVNGVLQAFRCADDDGDGVPDDSTCRDQLAWADDIRPFKADGPLQVGRPTADTESEYFAGTVDDLWVFRGALSPSQVQVIANSWFGLPIEVPPGV
ncbi:LamG domain-containing protein [Streptomyces sp. NPDC057499]|uniref:LamG domain-containing protein n=1 Tax=Streptomyces sp. NPDC057499 TaxID=3346150 RepID=UPI00369FF82D